MTDAALIGDCRVMPGLLNARAQHEPRYAKAAADLERVIADLEKDLRQSARDRLYDPQKLYRARDWVTEDRALVSENAA